MPKAGASTMTKRDPWIEGATRAILLREWIHRNKPVVWLPDWRDCRL